MPSQSIKRYCDIKIFLISLKSSVFVLFCNIKFWFTWPCWWICPFTCLSVHQNVIIHQILALLSQRLKWAFSDQNLSYVRLGHCHHHCRHCGHRNILTFSSSSPEPLDQFQPNLTQSILGWWGFKIVQMKEGPPGLFSRGDNYEIVIIPWQNLKIFSRTTEPISIKSGTK